MKQDFAKTIAEATDLVQHGKLMEATSLIQQALGTTLDTAHAPENPVAPPLPHGTLTATRAAEVDLYETPVRPIAKRSRVAEPVTDTSHFIEHAYAGPGPTGTYKLFVPSMPVDPAPLVVMLHGCTQDPDDFAAGTAMNERAEKDGFLVLYPAQSAGANPSRCWNWFRREDQQRGAGEPEMIAGMTREVLAAHAIDPDRIYVAGLSAGGAMAAVMGVQYPELFAAVGVHSGLPTGAAANIPDALTAMRSGVSRARNRAASAPPEAFVPTIVFHGDRDNTVHPDNGQAVVEDAVARAGDGTVAEAAVTEGESALGRKYTRSVHADASGTASAEHWVVHESAHAWSGGDSAGSHTDPAGPSASDEMIRFFLAHPRRK